MIARYKSIRLVEGDLPNLITQAVMRTVISSACSILENNYVSKSIQQLEKAYKVGGMGAILLRGWDEIIIK